VKREEIPHDLHLSGYKPRHRICPKESFNLGNYNESSVEIKALDGAPASYKSEHVLVMSGIRYFSNGKEYNATNYALTFQSKLDLWCNLFSQQFPPVLSTLVLEFYD
jgi:hypothetical protein